MPTDVQYDYFKFATACNGDLFSDDDDAVAARCGADEHRLGGHDASRAFLVLAALISRHKLHEHEAQLQK
eukprot:1030053-Pleurochrysis_carterae.AAC.1